MRSYFKFLIVLFFTATGLSAHAQFYGAASANLSTVSSPSSGSTFGLGVLIGYELNPTIAIEVDGRMTNLFTTSNSSNNGLDATSNNQNNFAGLLAIVVSKRMSDDISVFGRLGYSQAIKVTTGNEAVTSGVAFGAGARFHINEQASIRAEFTRLPKINSFGIGMQINF